MEFFAFQIMVKAAFVRRVKHFIISNEEKQIWAHQKVECFESEMV
jgi:hypothetical protein